jgi:formate-dependent nitrite reductase membrane component NrfD
MPAEHFVTAPNWKWWILAYFFMAGISGGAYALGTMLRLFGQPRDEAAARLAFYIAFPTLLVCPLLLTIDLGQPARFWHMMVDTGPAGGLNFKYWSPMSLGVWALQLYGLFAFVTFVDTLVRDRRLRLGPGDRLAALMAGGVGAIFTVIGTVLALFIAAYTGVLLSVSNQPVWSDTWALGALFLASGMSGAAATILLLSRWRGEAAASEEKLTRADSYFILLEVLLIVVFFATLAASGTIVHAVGGGWFFFWLIVLACLVVPLLVHFRRWPASVPMSVALTSVVVLVGVLALRAVVIFSAQT